MNNVERIKKHYIQPAIRTTEVFWSGKKGHGHEYEIETKIWVDQHLPEYRVAIPNKLSFEEIDFEMRFITYVPTGRVVYDNTLPKERAIVFEYILESLLGKKDLAHK